MANEQMVSAIVPYGTTDLPHQGYYRSKLFSLHDDLSPFVSAASPIFSLLDRFVVAEHLPQLKRVMANLDHELKAFQSQLLSQSQSQTSLNIAYFLLTSTIDEVLARSYMRLEGRAPTFTAFTPATYPSAEGSTGFFSMLNVLKKRPDEHLPLLELAYYCLMAGYEGEQHGRPDGRQILEAEIDELFRMIMQFRPQREVRLFDSPKKPVVVKQPFYLFIALGVAMLFCLLGSAYLSETVLNNQANKLRFTPAFITDLDA